MTKQPATDARRHFNDRLTAYMSAAGAIGATVTSEAHAVPVGSTAVQPFGINGFVSLDFNADGQIDFQIDHDRVVVQGTTIDYLQIDKNDVNGESNPLPIDSLATFPAGATSPNDPADAAYVTGSSMVGSYPAALTFGTPIGPLSSFDFQETDNFQATGDTIRANRLIDEDATQIDQLLGGLMASQVQIPFNGPNFVGLGGEVRYIGVRMDLNSTNQINYGWIGLRITNEADATGEVVGWGYETTPGVPILAGTAGPGIAVSEPSTFMLIGAAVLFACLGRKCLSGR